MRGPGLILYEVNKVLYKGRELEYFNVVQVKVYELMIVP